MAKGVKKCPKCNQEMSARTIKCKECNHVFEKKKPVANKKVLKKGETRRGVKLCPKCSTAGGGRTKICKECNYKFPKAEKKPKNIGIGKGQKICHGCTKTVGSPTKVCKHCNYEFSKKETIEKEIEPEIIEEVIEEIDHNLSIEEEITEEITEEKNTEENIEEELQVIDNMDSKELEVLNKNLSIPDKISAIPDENIDELIEEERRIENHIFEKTKPIFPDHCSHCEELIIPEKIEMEEKYTPLAQALRIVGYGQKRAISLLKYAEKNKCWSHVDWDEVREQIIV